MSCCSCFPFLSKNKDEDGDGSHNEQNTRTVKEIGAGNEDGNNGENRTIAAQTFTFRELASATKNFRPECLLGEGGFGRVYKGTLEKSGQVVAVKQLDRNGMHGNKDFLSEVLTLNLLHHQNLVNLVGYCADGDQRLLVYEFMSGGSLEEHLLDFKPEMKPLDWFTRMKIASGIATGLEYLHEKANPPVIYRDLKSSNILLDEESNPKLSDIGLAKLGNNGDKKSVLPSRVMGTYGYSAPEYTRSGELTLKSDVYSFGVVLLELITGRRALDTTRPNTEQNLVTWAQPLFRDPKRFPEMADPLLRGQFPERGLNQAVAIAAMCLQEESSVRPLISDISSALGFLAIPSADDLPPPLPAPDENCSKEEVVEDQEIQGSDNSGDEYSVFDEDEDENKEDNSGQKDGLSISTPKGQRDSQRESDSGKSDGSYASASSSRNVSRKTTDKSSSESQLGNAASKQIRGSSNEREMNGNASIAPKRSNTAENTSAYSSPRNSINGESLNGNDSFRHRSTSKKDGTDNYFAHSFSIASTGSQTNDELGNTGHRSNKNSLKSSKSLSKILRNRLSLTSSNKKKAVQELEPGSEASS